MPKVSALTAVTTPTTDDLVYLVDTPGGTPASGNATIANLLGANLTAERALTTANNLITKWTGAGTASTVDLTTDWLTQYPLAAGRGASQTIIGAASGATGTLVVQGSADTTTAGAISLRSPVRLRDIANETLTSEVAPLLRIRQTHTVDFSAGGGASFGGGGVAASAGLIAFDGTVKWNQTANTFGSRLFTNTSLYTNVSTVALGLGVLASFESRWTATADAAAVTLGAIADFYSGPTLNRTGGGTLSSPTDFVNFEGTATISTGVTVAMYRPFVAKGPTVTGTITQYQGVTVDNIASGDAVNATGLLVNNMSTTGTNIGVDIGRAQGGTTNISLRNAGPEVATPFPVTITAVGNTISHAAKLVTLNNTSGSSKTLTSAPTIADGADGELLTLVNVGTSDVVIQDQGTLASSNLRLAATTRTLSTRDSIRLVYNATVADWVEIGFTNVL